MAPQPPLAPASKPPLGDCTIRYTLRSERLRPTAHTSGLVLKTPLLGRWVTSLSLIGRRNRAGAWQARLFLCPHALCVSKNRTSRYAATGMSIRPALHAIAISSDGSINFYN